MSDLVIRVEMRDKDTRTVAMVQRTITDFHPRRSREAAREFGGLLVEAMVHDIMDVLSEEDS